MTCNTTNLKQGLYEEFYINIKVVRMGWGANIRAYQRTKDTFEILIHSIFFVSKR